MKGGVALEIGCGKGAGVELILDLFDADHVDAFDLDPDMICQARRRLRSKKDAVQLWTGDATQIMAEGNCYDTVFDFGVIHHIPNWEVALREVYRVLKPGGRFYAEEVLAKFILSPIWRRVLDHPLEDRFDHQRFCRSLEKFGFTLASTKQLWGRFAWFVADK